MLQFLHKTLISSKYSFGQIQCAFGNCFKGFQRKTKKKFPLKVMKWWKNLSYSIPFTGHLQISFEEPAAKNSHIIQKWRKNFLRRTFFLLIFLGTAKIQIWHPCRKNFATGPKYFCWKSEFDEKKVPSNKKLSLQRFPSGTNNAVLAGIVKIFSWKKVNSALKLMKLWRNIFFIGKFFKTFLRTRRLQFWNFL